MGSRQRRAWQTEQSGDCQVFRVELSSVEGESIGDWLLNAKLWDHSVGATSWTEY